MALVLGLGLRVGKKRRWLSDSARFFARFFNTDEKVSETQLLDTSGNNRHFTLTRRNCLVGDGVAKLTFSSLPTYDLLTIVENGVQVEKTLTANELVLDDTKKYNYAIFSNESVEIAKFPLMEYDSDYMEAPETMLNFDVIGNTECSFDGAIGKADGLSWNFAHGFTLADGIYFPKSMGEGYAGEPEGGVVYAAYHTAANQYIKAPADDVVLIASDTEEQFYDAGSPVDVHLCDIYANDYVQVTGVGVVTDLKILAAQLDGLTFEGDTELLTFEGDTELITFET